MELGINVTPAVFTKTHQESIFTNQVISEAESLPLYLWYILVVVDWWTSPHECLFYGEEGSSFPSKGETRRVSELQGNNTNT